MQIPRNFPKEFEPGVIMTLNNKGFMFKDMHPAATEFIKFAKTAKKPVVDIGCAFGFYTYPALEAGADVIAVDACQEHLDILESNVPDSCKSHLQTICGNFPEEFDFKEGFISGILISQLLPFLTPEVIITSLNKCYHWLESNGYIFIHSMTPHMPFYDGYYSTYKKKVKNNAKWPGILNPLDYSSEEYKDALPSYLNLLDKKTLVRECESAGFKIVLAKYHFPPDSDQRYYRNGKEFVSVVAQKHRCNP